MLTLDDTIRQLTTAQLHAQLAHEAALAARHTRCDTPAGHCTHRARHLRQADLLLEELTRRGST